MRPLGTVPFGSFLTFVPLGTVPFGSFVNLFNCRVVSFGVTFFLRMLGDVSICVSEAGSAF